MKNFIKIISPIVICLFALFCHFMTIDEDIKIYEALILALSSSILIIIAFAIMIKRTFVEAFVIVASIMLIGLFTFFVITNYDGFTIIDFLKGVAIVVLIDIVVITICRVIAKKRTNVKDKIKKLKK